MSLVGEGLEDMPEDGAEWIGSLFGDEPRDEEGVEIRDAAPDAVVELEELLSVPRGYSGSLDDLLAESVGAMDEAAEVAGMRARLGKDSGGMTQTERAELQAKIDAWEMVHVWRKVASVAVFHRVVCKGCGHLTESFRHFMQRCEGVKDGALQRWYRVREYDWHLPREVIFTETEVEMCAECACFEGWNLGEGEVKAHGEF